MFDKTGTLTKGTFQVTEVHPNGMKEEELLELTAYAEYHSNHPIATSIQTAYGKEIELERLGAVKEIAGHGIEAQIDGRTVYAGNAKLMELKQIPFEPAHVVGTIVYVAVEHQYAGYLLITDEVKKMPKRLLKS